MRHVRQEVAGLLFAEAVAVFSEDMLYRYRLERCWDPARRRMLFIMLNPSTADAFVLDPTVRRCVGFARREGCGSVEVVNLFALRSTDPKALYEHEDPVGPDNLEQIAEAIDGADILVAAWGAHAGPLAETVANQPSAVLDLADEAGKSLLCLGLTQAGHPCHPLYVKAEQPLVTYQGENR